MNDTIKVICENGFGELEVPMGTPLLEVAERLTPGLHPFLAAFVNNRIKELNYKIYTPVSVRFVDITSFSGIRVYQRTAWFLLQKGRQGPLPGQTLHIRHSMGQSGFYCEVEGIDEFTPDEAAQHSATACGNSPCATCPSRASACSPPRSAPATPRRASRTRSRCWTPARGFTATSIRSTTRRVTSTARWRPRRAMSTGSASNPTTTASTWPCRCARRPIAHRNVHQEKMFGIFQEYQSWVRIMGVPTVGDVNSKVLAGDAGGLIKLAEAFHERKFAWVADTIYDANISRGVRMVLISGPS